MAISKDFVCRQINLISKTRCHLDIPKILSTNLWTCRNSEFGDPLKSINFYMVDHKWYLFVCRLAKIYLVTIFDCDYRWYCNIVLGSIIFSIIFNGFLAINHLLCITDEISEVESVAQCSVRTWVRFAAEEPHFNFDMQQ